MRANAREISSDPLVRCKHVVVAAGGDEILHGIDLALAAGEFVAIVGPSGAGKSTLLNTLSGEISPRQGTVEVAGRPLQSWTARQLATRRAVLPQSSTLSFGFPVVDVVRMGRMPYGSGASQNNSDNGSGSDGPGGDGPGGDGDRQALQALARAQVIHLAHRNYATLSGGERQRVQFARVLAQVGLERRDGRYLLLDEPTASLDVAHAWQILAVARSLTRQKVAVVCVLHDLNLAASFADRILVMAQGEIVCRGRPRQVLTESAIETHFGIAVDVIDHPSRDAPLVAVRAPGAQYKRRSEQPASNL